MEAGPVGPSPGRPGTVRARSSVLLTVSGDSGVSGAAQVTTSPLSLTLSLDIYLSVSCGEGNQFRTRDVARPADNGGTECLGKKYSIGGKVRPDMTDSSLLLTDLHLS